MCTMGEIALDGNVRAPQKAFPTSRIHVVTNIWIPINVTKPYAKSAEVFSDILPI